MCTRPETHRVAEGSDRAKSAMSNASEVTEGTVTIKIERDQSVHVFGKEEQNLIVRSNKERSFLN